MASDNPRGYTDSELWYIASAPTLATQRDVEFGILAERLADVAKITNSVYSFNGVAQVEAMIADTRAEYTRKMRNPMSS
jgi:hypothetical protein